jgi:putative tricarboxylic transport membrane protein
MTPARELKDNKRFLSGLMFLGIGAVAIYMAQNYPMGSALRMGPGYFPIVLGGIMGLFGIYEMILGMMKPDPVKGNWSLRALVILPVAAVIFGILMERAGFIPALIVLVFIASLAGDEFKFIEVALLAVGLTILSVGLFIYGLGLPYPLIHGMY